VYSATGGSQFRPVEPDANFPQEDDVLIDLQKYGSSSSQHLNSNYANGPGNPSGQCHHGLSNGGTVPNGSKVTPEKGISWVYELYKRLRIKNSHATAACIKAWSLVGNSSQARIFFENYRKLQKSSKNSEYRFIVFQAGLDAASRLKDRELERYVRLAIFEDEVHGLDEFFDRRSKINCQVHPQITHPKLFTDFGNSCQGRGESQW